MKNLLSITSILLCILLTACVNDSSIGIIGGADGPTSVMVTEKGEKALYEQISADVAKLQQKVLQNLVTSISWRIKNFIL